MDWQDLPPTGVLLSELEAVAQAAQQLRDKMGKANNIPPDFPVGALNDMALGLGGLVHGTAGACRVPLENAHKELRTLRFDHFVLPQEKGDEWDNSPSKLERDSTIDKAMQGLKSAIEIALECFLRLVGHELEDDLEPRPKTPNPVLKERRFIMKMNFLIRPLKARLKPRWKWLVWKQRVDSIFWPGFKMD